MFIVKVLSFSPKPMTLEGNELWGRGYFSSAGSAPTVTRYPVEGVVGFLQQAETIGGVSVEKKQPLPTPGAAASVQDRDQDEYQHDRQVVMEKAWREGMKDIGKPCTVKPYARFDEGALKRRRLWTTQ